MGRDLCQLVIKEKKMRPLREYYTREHPHWPNNENEALDEISEINDLLDKGGWNKAQRDWAYGRRKKLIRYVNDPAYRVFTAGVNKAIETRLKNESEGKGNGN